MITSTANPQIKAIRKLRERKERQETGLFCVEGLRIVGDAFDHQAVIDSLLIAPELLISEYGRDLVAKAISLNIPVLELESSVFHSISQKENPQGLAAICHQKWSAIDEIVISPGSLSVALDSVADPGNLGTIMRTLDGVGGTHLFLLDHSTDPYDPTAMRASMGSLFNLTLCKTTLQEFGHWKQSRKLFVIGTSDSARDDYHKYPYPEPMILLMGSERQGLSEAHYAICDGVVSIPMAGSADSLNLAAATAVVLYEIFNQRRLPDQVPGGKE